MTSHDVPIPELDRYRIVLRLARATRFPFEHGGVLRGLLSRALGQHGLGAGVIPFPCESGRVRYQPGDPYALGLTLVGESRALFGDLLAGLERLGGMRRQAPAPILGGNFVVETVTQLPPPDFATDDASLAEAHSLTLRFVSPLRLARPEELKKRGAGYLDRNCFPVEVFLDRLWRRLFFLARGRYPDAEERDALAPPLPAGITAEADDLLWVDLPVRGTKQKAKPYTLGGVRGRLVIDGLDRSWRRVLVVGSQVHAGNSTGFGLGRFVIEDLPGDMDPGFSRARTLLQDVALPARLERALDHVLDNNDNPEGSVLDEGLVDELRRELERGTYRPEPLAGWVEPKADGGVRPLAVPVLRDRVAQRSAVEALGEAIDALLEETSFAYRRGFSRQGAARAIERAYADGYRHVLDADIRAFFDLVDWRLLFAKLDALFPNEPLVELLRAWVAAPVRFDGRLIERRRGLPQGSSVSPLLANLYLDTFDEALLDQGFRLVRYADDFVVLTKDVERARAAKVEVEKALADLRLTLNQEETAIRSIDDGFSYLGFLLVRSMVVESEKADRDAAAENFTLADDAVPAGSWLAAVPFERLEALLADRPLPARRSAGGERIPLADETSLRHERWPLYVTTAETRIHLQGGALVIAGQASEREVPLATLSHAVFIGRVRATLPVLRGMARQGIPSFFCRVSGELEAVFGPQEVDGALWLEQARAAADERLRLSFAAEVVAARLRNLAAVVVRLGWGAGSEVAAALRDLAHETRNKTTLEALRGLEGKGTALAFGALAEALPEAWGFAGRVRRPPGDPVNAMLSFGYTLLYNHAATALVEVGLHPRLGLFHVSRGTHAALASDLIEELRHLVETFVWTLIRRRQIRPEDFRPSADGRYPALLRPSARQVFIDAFERRLTSEFTPDGEDKPISYRGFLERQARQIRELVRGRSPLYSPLVLSG